MVEIVPAIIAKNFHELAKKIRLVEPYVNWVQLDVMDGKFAPEKTWSEPGELKNLDVSTNIEAHLMVEEPEKLIDKWLNSGAKRILVHYEALKGDLRNKIYDLRNKCEEHGVEFGLVLNLETPIKSLSLLHVTGYMLHVVQLMSIAQIGYHGHPFDEKVIHKIKALREKYPDVKISVDGGINLQNAKLVVEAGTDILIVGSTIFNSQDIGRTIEHLKAQDKT